jgi:hypothetical protein
MNQPANDLRSLIDLVQRLARDIAWQEPYAPGKWRRVQVLGHLVDSASNNHQRFVRAMLQPSLEFLAYDPNGSVDVQCYDSFPAATLLELWSSYNTLLAHVIERISVQALTVSCKIGADEPVTLEFLATDYVRHLTHHLKQILPENTL